LRGGQVRATGESGFEIRVFAGCGIVADSEPEAELAETELKLAPVRGALR
ncbi:MAG: hypothetical protein RL167_808, partial [Actinomycetota bacterium]